MSRYFWLIPFLLLFLAYIVIFTLMPMGDVLYAPGVADSSQIHISYAWQLTPSTRSIMESSQVWASILYFLLIPPIPLIHLWLLAQVYRHAYQPGERYKPYLLAGVVVAAITITEIFSIFFYLWLLTQNVFSDWGEQRSFVPLLWILICALNTLFGVLGAIYISRKRGFSARFRSGIIHSAIEVSFIPAIGILGGLVAWVAIIPGLIGFFVYRLGIERRLNHYGEPIAQTALDKLALDQMSISGFAGIVAALIAIIPSLGLTIFFRTQFGPLILLCGVGAGAVVSSWWTHRYVRHISENHKKKRDTIFTNNEPWFISMILYTGLWVALTFVAGYVLLTAARYFT